VTRVLLLGLPGCGASTVGAAVAARTGWPFLDSSLLLERATGGTAADLHADEGEPALRRADGDVVTLLLGLPAPLVACVPGAAVLDEALRQRLRDGGHVVWLRAGVPTLLARLGARVRPELGDDPEAGLRRMSEERAPLMEQVADLVLDVDLLTPSQAARQLVDALPSQPR